MATNGQAVNGIHTLTPNTTNSESSPPERLSPNSLGKRSYDEMKRGVIKSTTTDTVTYKPVKALTPVLTPPEPVPAPSDPRPPAGQIRALKLRYDPELNRSKTAKPTYVATGVDLRAKGICETGYVQHDKKSTEVRPTDTLVADIKNENPQRTSDPRLALANYAEGGWYIEGKYSKTRPRSSLRTQKPWNFDPVISIGRLPAKQVVVVGFDPFTPERNIRTLLETYGSIATLENCIDPANGSFLGVCRVVYADTETKHHSKKASDSARDAEKNGTGQKIGFRVVRIERDPTGNRAKRYCRRIIEGKQKEREKEARKELLKTNPAAVAPLLSTTQAPPNAPKGPATRVGAPPPTGPRASAAPAAPGLAKPPSRHSLLIEQTPVLATLDGQAYIFIPHTSVPVMGTTIEHLKKRLKSYNWEQVRCDQTGYYVVFEDSKAGIYEAERCHGGCNGKMLFTYTMYMILNRGSTGKPQQTRGSSPKRLLPRNTGVVEKVKLYEQDVADFENEKKERAERLDPVRGALEFLQAKVKDAVMDSIKKHIAAPALITYLDPDKHKERRRKHGIPDPTEKPATLSILPLETKPQTLHPGVGRTRVNAHSLTWTSSSPQVGKRPSVVDRQMLLQEGSRGMTSDAYLDVRRKKRIRPAKAAQETQVFRRTMDFLVPADDSDDDRQTHVTRDSNDVDSRAVSEIPVTPLRVGDDDLPLPKSKRRKVDKLAPPADSDEERDVVSLRKMFPHLLGKDPEDMARSELDQLVAGLDRSSLLRSRALNEIKVRKQAEEDDLLFGLGEGKGVPIPGVDIKMDGVDLVGAPEPTEDSTKAARKKAAKAVTKPKKKTKKQLLEEQEALQREELAKVDLHAALAEEDTPTPVAELSIEEEIEEPRAEVEWSVSTDKPRRTVEDDPDLFLDIDGWQHIVKDDEDLAFLRQALEPVDSSHIPDISLWAWDQKQIKALNNGGKIGLVDEAATIQGYYRPNPSGSARSEPVTRILNAEKNHYLPHRIRVQRAREEREAMAKTNTVETTKAAVPAAKLGVKPSSRHARAENRRVVNAVAVAKQALGEDNVAISLNQLKKRKKQVRFDRSAIHNWGLYADESIGANEMIIEYVGEVVRQKVADIREHRYDLQGVGSSYLFRMIDDRIVDATKKGGIARFINHSCDPSCTAKIIRVDGTHRIVIYALRDIMKNEELTYDYKFEREIGSADRIPCLCGAVNCKGFLN